MTRNNFLKIIGLGALVPFLGCVEKKKKAPPNIIFQDIREGDLLEWESKNGFQVVGKIEDAVSLEELTSGITIVARRG